MKGVFGPKIEFDTNFLPAASSPEVSATPKLLLEEAAGQKFVPNSVLGTDFC